MIEALPESEGNLLILKATSKLTDADQKQIVALLESIVREHGKIRLLFEMDDEFDRRQAEALWDNLGPAHRNHFEKLGTVFIVIPACF